MKMRFLMTLMFASLCVSVPRAQGAEGHAGGSGKKVASIPVDVSAFAQEIDRLVAGELKRFEQEPRPEIDDYTFCRRCFRCIHCSCQRHCSLSGRMFRLAWLFPRPVRARNRFQML